MPALWSLVGLELGTALFSSTDPGNIRVSAMGEIALAVTPYFPRSFAVVLVSPTMASDAAA